MDEKMNKRPSMQFYPADWRKDPQLQMCSMSTQGIWINLLCIMWEAEIEGVVTGKQEELTRLIGCSLEEFLKFENEINRHNFGDVTKCNGDVTVVNRRMKKAFIDRKNTNERVKKYRKRQRNGNVTLYSSSSSSSSSSNNINTVFFKALKSYPGTKRGVETEFEYFVKKTKNWEQVLPLLQPAIELQKEHLWKDTEKKYIPHFKTWIFQKRWEIQVAVEKKETNEEFCERMKIPE